MLNALAIALTLHIVQAVAVSPEVVGQWRFSSGDPSLLTKTSNGSEASEGRAASKLLTLRADGTYRQESSILMGRKGHRMRLSSTVEGRFEAQGGRIRFMVDRGRQSGEDNMIESGNYDRILPPDLVKRMSESSGYRTRDEGGRPVLVLLPTEIPTDSVTFLKYSSGS